MIQDKKERKKVALYCRVSKEETDSTKERYQDPENQLQPLREWAKRMNWEIVAEYVDRASGADATRENFREMLNHAMLRKFHDILVWKFDRFSREPMFTAVGRVQKLRKRGVGIKSFTENWLDTSKDNPMGDLILSFMAWAAAEERRKISERTKAGIARKKAQGTYRGGRPKGVKKRTPPSRSKSKIKK